MAEFKSFGKIPRLHHMHMTVTEKLDGTNACVVVSEDGEVSAQSRTRVIRPGDDNYGFALWVSQHEDELRELGEGYHFGEWWGVGIQRGYGLHERRFSLFNTYLWTESRPACCHVVPVLHKGPFDPLKLDEILSDLQVHGSTAAPGYYQPEGVIAYVEGIRTYVKHLVDPRPKGEISG